MKSTNEKTRLSVRLLAIICLLIAPLGANAAIYLQLEGITGDATAMGYEGWIELGSLSEGIAVGVSTATGGSREVSRPSFSDITVTKLLDSTSPYLRQKLVEGKAIPRAAISLVRVSTDRLIEYFRIDLTNVTLTSIAMSSGGDLPSESLSMTFEKVEWTYIPEGKPGGSPIKAGYDLTTGTKI